MILLVHWNGKEYFEWFFSQPNRFEIRPTIGEVILVELDGSWVNASIVEIDRNLSLAQFCFMRDSQPDRFEWLYLGSPRIEKIWRQIIRKKLLDRTLDFSVLEEDDEDDDDECVPIHRLPSTNQINRLQREVAPISNGENLGKNHECSHDCVKDEDGIDFDVEGLSLFHRPLAIGFKKISTGRVCFMAPCGRKLNTYQQIRDYLMKTNSKLRIDSFPLHRKFEPSQNLFKIQSTIFDKVSFAYINTQGEKY